MRYCMYFCNTLQDDNKPTQLQAMKKITLGSVLFWKPYHGKGCITISGITTTKVGTVYYYHQPNGKMAKFYEEDAERLFDLSQSQGGFFQGDFPQPQEVKQMFGHGSRTYNVPIEQVEEFKALALELHESEWPETFMLLKKIEQQFGKLLAE